MTISQNTQALLKAHAGRGFSDDPALTVRHKIRLLQGVSKTTTPWAGRGRPLLPAERKSGLHDQIRVVRALSTDLRRARVGR